MLCILFVKMIHIPLLNTQCQVKYLVDLDVFLSLPLPKQSVHPRVLSLPPLSPDDITAALQTKLHTDQRCLQEQQWQLLVQACMSCPCPLYLEVAYSESMLWTSYSPQASLSLPASLEGLFLGVLARLERELGRQLVRQAASLISISRWGVTEEVGEATFNYELHINIITNHFAHFLHF